MKSLALKWVQTKQTLLLTIYIQLLKQVLIHLDGAEPHTLMKGPWDSFSLRKRTQAAVFTSAALWLIDNSKGEDWDVES